MKAFGTAVALLAFLICWSVARISFAASNEEREAEDSTEEPSVTTPGEPQVPLRAEITGPESCASSDYFIQEVLRRTPKATRAIGGQAGWTLRVSVAERGKRYRAKLSILANEGMWLERELVAPSCDDALEALAVVVSVLAETAVEEVQQVLSQEPVAPGEKPKDAATRPIPLPYVAGGVWVPWLDDPKYFENRGVTPVSSRLIIAATAYVELDQQLAPKPTLGLDAGFEFSHWHPNLLNPSYGVSFGWAKNDMAAEKGDSIYLLGVSRLSLRGYGCPVELLRSRIFALRPCARAEFGTVYVRYVNPNGSHYSKSDPMFRLTPFARLSWSPIAGVELRLDGGVDLSVLKNRYVASATTETTAQLVYTPRSSGGHAALGLAVDW